jgi:hypothetical protein
MEQQVELQQLLAQQQTLMEQQVELNQKQTELIEQRDEVENKINALKKQIFSGKHWKPLYGEGYYFVNSVGDVVQQEWEHDQIDNWVYHTDNCFKTAEDAKRSLDRLNTRIKLKKLANDMNGDEGIDWTDNTPKFYIVYHTDTNKLDLAYNSSSKSLGQIYCTDCDFLDTALEQIGKEKLIELFIQE